MTSCLTEPSSRACVLLLAALSASACSPGIPEAERILSGPLLVGSFDSSSHPVTLTSNTYVTSSLDETGFNVVHTSIASGVSPHWFTMDPIRDVEISVVAEVLGYDQDAGWGIEFGMAEDGSVYRFLVYSSGRICLDRLGRDYPEFIHCTSKDPRANTGKAINSISAIAIGHKISIRLNNVEVISYSDERYNGGRIGLATAGAGTEVKFHRINIIRHK